MRCLAIANVCQDRKGHVVFLMESCEAALEARLISEGVETRTVHTERGSMKDAEETVRLAKEMAADWVVVDGYCFKANYQRHLHDSGLKLCLLDDEGKADSYFADIIHNADLGVGEELYSNRAPFTKLLLGLQYVLFRREFSKWVAWERDVAPKGRKVLITMGGSDPDNVTLKVIRALQKTGIEGLEIVAVVGASNPHGEQLRLAVQEFKVSVELKYNVTDMPSLMAWSDVTISAGGGTCWELLLLGTPTMILILAENQHANTFLLDQAGAAISLGWHDRITGEEIARRFIELCDNREKRTELSHAGRALIDGKGAVRVVDCLQAVP
jgi:UDP-2,4-diacetamido-2,4,6-trideoxy-beta-L-altropyranose hydrolase